VEIAVNHRTVPEIRAARLGKEDQEGATRIMLIRHAEKPNSAGILGVSVTGHEDRRSLTVHGWQRAGALIALFRPRRKQCSDALLSMPTAIYASRPTPNSARPLQTVEPLAQTLSISIDLSYGHEDEVALAGAASANNGIVLISWKRDGLPLLGHSIAGNLTTCPQLWPEDRFDVIWVFDRPDKTAPWTFTQVPQLLLPGDLAEPISAL
jgi:hypothetical protein